MEGFRVSSTLGKADWQALMHACAERANDRLAASGWKRWMSAVLWVAAVTVLVFCIQVWPRYLQPASLAGAFVLFLALAWAIGMRQRRAFQPADDGAFLGRVEFAFEADHFEASRAHSTSRNAWGLVREVSYTATHVMLWIDTVSAYIFRVADLPAPMTVEEAVARLRSFVASARAAAETVPPAGGDMDAPTTTPITAAAGQAAARPSVWQEIRALLRLESHRTVEPAHLYGRDLTLLLLAALAFALWVGLTRLDYSGDVEFMWYEVHATSTYVVGGLLLAWALSRFSVPPLSLRRALLLVLAAAPVFTLAAGLLRKFETVGVSIITMVAGAWIAGIWYSGLRAMTGMRQLRAFFAGLACVAVLVVIANHIYVPLDLWYQADPEFDYSPEKAAAREQRLFGQAAFIDAEIAAMAPGESPGSSMYFLGFAGYGGQRVFAEEIGTAARVVAAKFATGERQLLLVNDRRNDETYPLASVAALRHALMGLGRRMNREEDVLFLALSSHGSEDATLSVTHENMDYWRDLGAADLRAMLDESGIRWKVIVISACHAGSFIESLADDHTIVLTAAAKENASFGCSDDRDLTYFGEAFYRDALPQSASLRAAFDAARIAITDREKAEGREPSDPQAHFGAALESRLTAVR